MFRFNNPDALLVLLHGRRGVRRWCARSRTRRHPVAAAGRGAHRVRVPGQDGAGASSCCRRWRSPTWWPRRPGSGGGSASCSAAAARGGRAAGWWVAIVELWPASSRPYIGGSENNSVLELALGYNGLGRIFGRARRRAAGCRAARRRRGRRPGAARRTRWRRAVPVAAVRRRRRLITRCSTTEVGGQISWLLPAALVLLVVGLWLTRRAPRTDRMRASLLLWGGWTVVTALVFSFAQGIFHPYYTVALAPGIAALVGDRRDELWRRRAALAGPDRRWPWSSPAPRRGRGCCSARTPDFAAVAALGTWSPLAAVAVAGAARAGRAAAASPSSPRWPRCSPAPPPRPPTPADGDHEHSQRPGPSHRRPAATGSRPRRRHALGPGAAVPAGGAGGSTRATPTDPALVALLQSAGTKWSAATDERPSSAALALASGTDVMGIGGFTGARPGPDAGAVPGLRRGGRGALLRRRWRRPGRATRRSPPGCRRTSRRRPWAAGPSTT